MRILITGADGFVGRHLAWHLLRLGTVEVFGTTYLPTENYQYLSSAGVHLRQIDLTDDEAVRSLLAEIKPAHIYHLAAQSFVPRSFENPWETLRNNILSQLNLMHQMLWLELDSRFLVVGSAEIYGPISPDDLPLNEAQPPNPSSPYSVSKLTQDMLGRQYFLSHNLAAIRVRPFNQIGPGQSKQFVAPAFASQIAEIEADLKEPVLLVGNLTAMRDFTDVRDMVRAYVLLMEKGEPGSVYNIGTGQAYSIQELLDCLLTMTEASIEVRQDPSRFRPVEVPIIVCDPTKVWTATGWTPEYQFEDTLRDVLNDWRQRTSSRNA
nr:GDP-mannose 4,6-dehydratase [Anaerolineae bacterium]